MSELINCGERKIQKLGRIAIKEVLDRHGVEVGETVEVFIKIKE